MQGLTDQGQSKDLNPGPARLQSLESHSYTTPHPPPTATKALTPMTSLLVRLSSGDDAQKAFSPSEEETEAQGGEGSGPQSTR